MTALSIRLVHHSCHSVLVLGSELDGISAPLLRLPVDIRDDLSMRGSCDFRDTFAGTPMRIRPGLLRS